MLTATMALSHSRRVEEGTMAMAMTTTTTRMLGWQQIAIVEAIEEDVVVVV